MQNKIAQALKITAGSIFIVGFIGGFIFGGVYEVDHEFNTGLMFACWIGCFLQGMLFLGLSEIIERLHDSSTYQYQIYKYIKKIQEKESNNEDKKPVAKVFSDK